jgi:hypothetical protein
MNAPESLESGLGAFFGDRISRTQKTNEPIELNTEDFAQVLLVFGEKPPSAVVGIFERQHRFLQSRTGRSRSRYR